MSSRDRFRRADEIFRAVVHLEGDDREAYLREACAQDVSLRAEVEGLLAEDDNRTGVLDRPAVSLEQPPVGDGRAPREPMPERIGHYRVVRRIGVGGMGVVYEAEQDSPRRTVALKVINAGVAQPGALRRFMHEAQVLGRLQHPGIAQVFEAGSFDAGAGMQPYFAMEHIRGQMLTDYATVRGLGTRERLELIGRVCDAVQHAHERDVIHRDLKPANVLVDESGQPKILDFGVARATNSDIQMTTLRTDVGQLVGTIPYMSPEQATGDPDELDTRSDVYTLGVLAYELLAGRLPYDVKTKMVHEAVLVIRENDPRPLSTVDRVFAGDIDTIIAKTLEKDKTRRYQSAAALAADIRRYLADEPIRARPPSAVYQVRKFAKRNKAVVGGVTAVFVVLVAALIVVSGSLRAAQRERDEARRQARIAEAVNGFLNDDLLSAVDPLNVPDREITVRDVLDRAASAVDGRFGAEPLVEAAVRLTLGRTYLNLSEYEAAEPHLVRALDIRRREGRPAGEILEAVNLLGLVLADLGRFDDAEPYAEEALALSRRVLREDDPMIVDTMNNLASLRYRQRRFEDAEPIFVEAVALGRRFHPDAESTLAATASLALLLQRLRRFDEAEPMSTSAVEGYARVLGHEHPYTLTARNNLAILYSDRDEFDRADPIFRDVLAIRRRNLGDDHTDTLVSLAMMGRAYARAGRFEIAEQFAIEAQRGLERSVGGDHPYTRTASSILATIYEQWGKPEKAAGLRAEGQ